MIPKKEKKKDKMEENSDRIEWLKILYAEWKERQLSNKRFEREKHIVEPKDLNFDFEGRWQCDFWADIS